jgi:hypothetical protein
MLTFTAEALASPNRSNLGLRLASPFRSLREGEAWVPGTPSGFATPLGSPERSFPSGRRSLGSPERSFPPGLRLAKLVDEFWIFDPNPEHKIKNILCFCNLLAKTGVFKRAECSQASLASPDGVPEGSFALGNPGFAFPKGSFALGNPGFAFPKGTEWRSQ